MHINPLIEAASRRTIVPHEFVDMATFHTTKIGTMNVQVRIGGDMALMRGVAKAVFEAAATDPEVLDREFIERYTHGVRRVPRAVRGHAVGASWCEAPVSTSRRSASSPTSTCKSGRVIIAWCLGITQHEHGVDTIREIVNLLLLRGNIGREGAGPCPVRGHSNVQGNRTCGINHRPDEQFLDRLARGLRDRSAARARARVGRDDRGDARAATSRCSSRSAATSRSPRRTPPTRSRRCGTAS